MVQEVPDKGSAPTDKQIEGALGDSMCSLFISLICTLNSTYIAKYRYGWHLVMRHICTAYYKIDSEAKEMFPLLYWMQNILQRAEK